MTFIESIISDRSSICRYGCPLQADIAVHSMMKQLQADYPERREELIDMLGIDVNWRMHQVSDGQRRRVQIFIGLLRPFKILLLGKYALSCISISQ